MSRHRLVKNLNLADELDDDALSDDLAEGDYDMDEGQRAQMDSGVKAVQAVLGSQAGIPESEIREALWNFYFDVDQSIESLLDAKHKREAAEARKQDDSNPVAQEMESLQLEPAQPKVKMSLAQLAAASRKTGPSSLGSRTISSAGLSKSVLPNPAPSSATGKPLSKLAALAASRKEAVAGGQTTSKLQQRIISGYQPKQPVEVATPVVEEVMEEKLPQSALFQSSNEIVATPSPFAHILVPQNQASLAAIESLLQQTSDETAFAKPSPDDIVNTARKNATFNKRK